MSARLDVRLGDERKQRLDEIAEAQGVPVSEVVRGLIDEAWEAVMGERRKDAARRLIAMEVEDVPDPDILSRQLSERYEHCDLP